MARPSSPRVRLTSKTGGTESAADLSSTIDRIFLSSLERFPDRTLLRFRDASGERRMSYREVAGIVATMVARIGESALVPGDIAVCDDDEPLSLLFFVLACAFSGAVMLRVRLSDRAAAQSFLD